MGHYCLGRLAQLANPMEKFVSKVESIAQGGMGVLRHNGQVVFVPYVLPDEQVEAQIISKKKSFAKGRLLKVERASPNRISAKCEHFSDCGGCQFQHINYNFQVETKKKLVMDALSRIAKLKELPRIDINAASNIWGYRRHIRLKLWPNDQGFRIGFMGQNQFLPINRCHIFSHKSKDILLPKLNDLVSKFDQSIIKEARVTILKDGPSSVLFFEFEPRMPKNALSLIRSSLNKLDFFKGAIVADAHNYQVLGQADVEIKVLGQSFFCRPDAFVQNNPEQSEKIYLDLTNDILNLPEKNCPIIDLYSGIGISSILLAQRGFSVTGVEISPKAVALAEQNAIKNEVRVAWKAIPAEVAINGILDSNQIVIMNPPRTGAKLEVLDALLKAKPAHIFYISCMPPTLARDLKILTDGGYQMVSCKAYDMFPHTTHVETLVHLSLGFRGFKSFITMTSDRTKS